MTFSLTEEDALVIVVVIRTIELFIVILFLGYLVFGRKKS